MSDRPRRGLGRIVQALLYCPLCRDSGGNRGEHCEDKGDGYRKHAAETPLEIVGGFRANGVRLACPNCELRFTVPLLAERGGLADVLDRMNQQDDRGELDRVRVEDLRAGDLYSAFAPHERPTLENPGESYALEARNRRLLGLNREAPARSRGRREDPGDQSPAVR